MTHPKIEEFIATGPGQFFNPDHAHGFQCKDLADAYAEFIFGVPWAQSLGPANAKDAFNRAPDAYWQKILDRPGQLDWIPWAGDLIIWGGDAYNQFGHIALVTSATSHRVRVLQMDGFLQRAAWVTELGYNQAGTGNVIGWLRPRPDKLPALPKVKPTPATIRPGNATRVITADVAAVLTAPNSRAPLSRQYPNGIKQGATIGVLGYVAGEDITGRGDNAWFKTVSGLYVWANAAGNSLAGLRKL